MNYRPLTESQRLVNYCKQAMKMYRNKNLLYEKIKDYIEAADFEVLSYNDAIDIVQRVIRY